MAVTNKKVIKKPKQGLNTKKVIVNNSKKSTPPASTGTTISSNSDSSSPEEIPDEIPTELTKQEVDTKEFEQFYNKALQQYLIYKETNVEEPTKNSSYVSKIFKNGFKLVYKLSVTIFLIYLLKLYIVYQLRTYVSIGNVVPTSLTKSYNSIRIFIMVTFQHVVDFLQKNFGVAENLKLKNEKTLLVDNMVTNLQDSSYRSNLDSIALSIKLVFAIIIDYLSKIIPNSVFKYIQIAIQSIKDHLSIFKQRVFVEIGLLWKQYHPESYEYIAHLLAIIIAKIKFVANYSLEELKKLLF
ncbi:hypothetical protein HANVADRAFT_52668 [Hanseniaspora valbyensis NRRL Y-1626]|uniref:Uncharacterized protein n=1 Tax=Hanseniaspora valbyensis NRRL Y-1626 TaxID=766949 RepID=A0A1B7TDU3_9ASCO|nr:hypothetical protein HANVADRAFT_52668 [Hanseniaspora valbyensis NRRL Y-1626]